MKNKLVLVLILLIAGLASWYMFTDMSQKKILETTPPTTQQESTIPAITTEKSQHIPYTNTTYGFEFSFDPGYKDRWSVSEKTDTTGSAFEGALLFTLKDAPNPDIFSIHIYAKSWWKENAEIGTNKSAWKKGEEPSLGSALGIYLGENASFVFTLFPNDQTCPDLGVSGPGPLCELTEGKTDMVIKSFRIVERLLANDSAPIWKIYRDTEQGFEFKYPEECKASSDPTGRGVQILSLSNDNSNSCNFSIFYHQGSSSAFDSEKKNVDLLEEIYFQGYEAFTGIFQIPQTYNENLQKKHTYILRKNTIFIISYTLTDADRVYEIAIPMKILSTFKFIE